MTASTLIHPRSLLALALATLGLWLFLLETGCQPAVDRSITITLWHQMMVGERELLAEQIKEFERQHPEIRVKSLYKETEELRSGFQAAALAGTGPELVFGPADTMGAFMAMGIVQDLSPYFADQELQQISPLAQTWMQPPDREPLTQSAEPASAVGRRVLAGKPWLVQIGDRVGNHLALVYNRQLVPEPPQTSAELLQLAIDQTRDLDGDGRPDQYGLVWNFVEPFFLIPFLTGHGGWVFSSSEPALPELNTPANVRAMEYVAALQNKHQVLPRNCDYETADALFKNGKAAMIINGDWSWSEYLDSEQIDAGVAVLPLISTTGLPMQPMVATKGYSLNIWAGEREAEAALQFVKFMLTPDIQRAAMLRLKTMPSHREVLTDPKLASDPVLSQSARQIERGRPMPVIPEMRAVWDAMRPAYQQLLSGELTAAEAAAQMQREAKRGIAILNQDLQPTVGAHLIRGLAVVLVVVLILWQRHFWGRLWRDWRAQPLAYWMIAPACLVTILTVVYPFSYNIVLSFSNMSLQHFQDWQVVGWQNYQQVLLEPRFLEVLVKTIVWTVLNVTLHVVIGLTLAVALHGPIRGKSIYRTLLILPWAIPAYITALSWRGMFDYEYGAINAWMVQGLGLDRVNWLGEEVNAFLACLVTNVWLGFPFMMVVALGGLQGIPEELYEAARLDRISRWRQFWHITLPLLRPVLYPAITLGAVWTFNNLNVVWLVSNGGEPADQTHILVSYVYKLVFNLYQFGQGAALSMLIFAVLLMVSLGSLWRLQATEEINR